MDKKQGAGGLVVHAVMWAERAGCSPWAVGRAALAAVCDDSRAAMVRNRDAYIMDDMRFRECEAWRYAFHALTPVQRERARMAREMS